MATDFIYQVNSAGEVLEEYITPSDFYESDYVTAWCDYFYDEDEYDDYHDDEEQKPSAFSLFSELVKGERFKDVVSMDTEEETITLYPGFKEVWFARQFEEFKALTAACTIEDFMDDLYEYRVRNLLGGSFDAFIRDEADGSIKKIDLYFRQLRLDEPVTFHFGGFVAFHY